MDVFFVVSNLLKKQSNVRWSEMPWRSCVFTVMWGTETSIRGHVYSHPTVFIELLSLMEKVSASPRILWDIIIHCCQRFLLYMSPWNHRHSSDVWLWHQMIVMSSHIADKLTVFSAACSGSQHRDYDQIRSSLVSSPHDDVESCGLIDSRGKCASMTQMLYFFVFGLLIGNIFL